MLNKYLYILFFLIIFSGCLKSRLNKEQEENQILEYISDLGIDFYKSQKGYYYHIEYSGNTKKIKKGDSITLIYNGYNLDTKKFFIKNDTVKFILGENKINSSVEDFLLMLHDGAVGIIILPNYLAYSYYRLPNVESHSTIALFFRVSSKNKLTNKMAEFYSFTQQNIKEFEIITDSSVYINIDFNGIGISSQNLHTIRIEYQARILEDTNIFDQKDTLVLQLDNNNLVKGLNNALKYLYDGDMAEVYIPPNLAYGINPPFEIPPYSPLHYTVRLLSEDPDIAEDSNIKKFIFTHNFQTIDTLNSGIIYIPIEQHSTQPLPKISDTLLIEYYEAVINNPVAYSFCTECKKKLNNNNFISSLTEAIAQNLHKNDKAYFIIPYRLIQNNNQENNLPPYSTIVYYIWLKEIIEP